MSLRVTSLLATLAALLLVACDNPPAQQPVAQPTPPTPDAGQQPAQQPGQNPTPTPTPVADPSGKAAMDPMCDQYAKQICGAAGEQSETCASVKLVGGIIHPSACKAGVDNVQYSLDKLKDMRKTCDQLVEKLCNDIGKDTESCKMVTERTKEFPAERCSMMMEHYPEVVEGLKKQEEANKPLTPEKMTKIAADDAPSFGPKDAKVVLVEFSDFQCPYCSAAAKATKQIKEKYGDKVRFVFRQFPLPFHQDAHPASQAALFAHEQGKFWEFHDLLFENQRALTREDLEKYADQLKLDKAKFKKALDEKTYAAKVDADMKLGEEVVVQGTPTLFLNGARVANPTDFEDISKRIDEALAK